MVERVVVDGDGLAVPLVLERLGERERPDRRVVVVAELGCTFLEPLSPASFLSCPFPSNETCPPSTPSSCFFPPPKGAQGIKNLLINHRSSLPNAPETHPTSPKMSGLCHPKETLTTPPIEDPMIPVCCG